MKAIDRAVNYLNIKPRTEAQVRSYLEGKNHQPEEIDEAIRLLEEYHYIDDESFARMYIELGFDKGHGINRIKQELSKKGVSRDAVESAFDSLEGIPDQHERALEIGRQILPADVQELDYQEKQKLRARIARRLATRGYSANICYDAAKELVK